MQNRRPSPRRVIWNLTILIGLAISLVGCASPKAVVESPAELHKYRKVYISILEKEKDPRVVYPRVVSRLKQCGFDLIEVAPDGAGAGTQGTGFILSEQGHLLTCAHVVHTNLSATVWLNNVRHPAKVLSTDTNLDVALIQIPGLTNTKPLLFATNDVYRMGQDVFTMGFPLVEILGTSPRLNKGLISATAGFEDNPKQIQISAEVQPGNSGGPLLDAQGRIAGLVIATLNPMNVLARSGGNLPQNVNFAVKNAPLREFLHTAGLTLPEPNAAPTQPDFEAVRESLAIVRSGNVTEEDLTAPSLNCSVSYVSLWDVWYRFRVFHVEFRDTKTGKLVLRAGQYADNPLSSENSVVDETFKAIYAKFYPDRPNPFAGQHAQPQPETR